MFVNMLTIPARKAMDTSWNADVLAMQVLVWRLCLDGAVRPAQLANEFERNIPWVPREEAQRLVILALLARAAGAPDPVC